MQFSTIDATQGARQGTIFGATHHFRCQESAANAQGSAERTTAAVYNFS
jgi:hypothetical protein